MIRAMPLRAIDDPDKLRRLMSAMLLIEADLDLPSLLERLAQEACALVGARYGAMGVLNAERSGLAEFITVGVDPKDVQAIGALPTGHGILGLLISDPRPLRLSDIESHPDHHGLPSHHPQMRSFLGVPVKVRDAVYGNLYLTEKEGSADFTTDDEAMVTALAASAGIAIENAQLHQRVQQLAVLDDRERIARDLHDAVIQRLFAVGLSLQGMVRAASSTGLCDRLEKAVSDIDETIRQIRSTIFELTSPVHGHGLRSDVVELVRELDAVTGFEVRVTFEGPVDTAVDTEVAEELRAIVREALTNVARHARASEAAVSVGVSDGWCSVTVTDDGVGPDRAKKQRPRTSGDGGMGLANARRRAEKLGGHCTVGAAEGGGTKLTWRVPLGL
jgi:signal transduction histidine kinase